MRPTSVLAFALALALAPTAALRADVLDLETATVID